MTTKEIIESINIGFCQPKFYKRSVWNKAVKVMEYLSDNTNGEVSRHNFGPGKGKYTSTGITPYKLEIWALKYKMHIGEPLTMLDVVPAMEELSKELGVPTKSGEVFIEFYKRNPEFKQSK